MKLCFYGLVDEGLAFREILKDRYCYLNESAVISPQNLRRSLLSAKVICLKRMLKSLQSITMLCVLMESFIIFIRFHYSKALSQDSW